MPNFNFLKFCPYSGHALGFINDDEVFILVNFKSIVVFARTFFSFFLKNVLGALGTSLKIAKFQFSEILTLLGMRPRVYKWWWSFNFSEFQIYSSIPPDVFFIFPKNAFGILETNLKISKFQFSEILTLLRARQRVHKWWWSFSFESIAVYAWTFLKNVLEALGTSLRIAKFQFSELLT